MPVPTMTQTCPDNDSNHELHATTIGGNYVDGGASPADEIAEITAEIERLRGLVRVEDERQAAEAKPVLDESGKPITGLVYDSKGL